MKQGRIFLNNQTDLAQPVDTDNSDYFTEIIVDPAVADWQQLRMINPDKFRRVVFPLEGATEKAFKEYHHTADNALWLRYWEAIAQTAKLAGSGKVFVILIAGIGETEQQFAQICQRICNLGAEVTLLSSGGDRIPGKRAITIGRYRRMQMIRYLIAEEISDAGNMQFNEFGSIFEFGVPKKRINRILQEATPFFTVGTGNINPADYEWPGHDNKCVNLRNFSPDMDEEQKEQARREYTMVNWEEEWSTLGFLIRNSDYDPVYMEDEEDFPLMPLSAEDLRYLKHQN